jgi:hypothetical protein
MAAAQLSDASKTKPVEGGKRSWCDSHGSGDRSGVWGLKGAAGEMLATAGTLLILTASPAFVIGM